MGRGSVPKNLAAEIVSRNHSLDEFFGKVDLELKLRPPKKKRGDSDYESDEESELSKLESEGCMDIKRVGVFATDLDEFVSYLMVQRGLDPGATLVKIGLDDGQVAPSPPTRHLQIISRFFSGDI